MRHNQHTGKWDWPFSAETRVRSQFSPCETYSGHSNNVPAFSRRTSPFPCQQRQSTNAPHILLCCSYKDKWAEPGNLPNKVLFLEAPALPPPTHMHLLYILMCVTKLPREATSAADLKQGNSGHKSYTAGLPLLEIMTASRRHYADSCCSCSCCHMQFVISDMFYTWGKTGRPDEQEGLHTKFG